MDFEDGFDNVFRLRPRYQDCGINSKVAAIEFLPPENILKGNAADAVVESIFERLRFFSVSTRSSWAIEILALDGQNVGRAEVPQSGGRSRRDAIQGARSADRSASRMVTPPVLFSSRSVWK